MPYSILRHGVLIGTTELTPAPLPEHSAPQLDTAGTLVGELVPTPAYEAIRGTCQAPAMRLMAAGDATADAGAVGDFAEALGAVWALDLVLADEAGHVVPTQQVFIQDFSGLALPPSADAPPGAPSPTAGLGILVSVILASARDG